jgi:Tol biopolymer transport system component
MSEANRRFARVVAFALAFVVAGTTARAQYPITRISLDSSGHEGNGPSGYFGLPGALSADGRQVAFESFATNLVPGDTNAAADIFVHDNVTGATVRVSIDSSGHEANGPSFYPAISGDGRFVTFTSVADNLVASDTNKAYDIFRHDRDPDGNTIFDEGNGVTERVSVDSNGAEANGYSITSSISADGVLVAFSSAADNLVASDQNQCMDVFLRDLSTGTTIRITKGGNGNSDLPSISADGKFIAFTSVAANLVPGDTNHGEDVFVYDVANPTITRVSVDSSGNEASGRGPSPLSRDGSIVAFTSESSNLVAGDSNGRPDVFVHDRTSGVTTRESVDPGGVQYLDFSGYPALSGDGNVVTFMRHIIKLGNQGWYDTDFRPFARDRAADTTLALNVHCGGVAADGDGMLPGVSDDGRFVGFLSRADDLVAGDTNGTGDLFLYDLTIVEPDAAWSNYGAGYAGTFGVPTLALSADPVLGTTPTLDLGNSSGTFAVGFLLIGANSASLGTARGGTILVDFLAIEPIALWPGGLSLGVALPLDPAWCGASVYVQAIELDAGAQYGLSFTPGLQATFGK